MIIVFGSLNIDLVMPVNHFPKPGETVLCSTDYLSRPGGKGANQAMAAAKAGGKVALVGKVGDDSFGRRSVNNLKSAGIWTSGIGISERPTGCATIAVDMTGENIVIAAPGANLDATSDQVPEEVFGPKNIVLTQLEVAPAEALAVLSRAKKKGSVTILNAAPVGQMPANQLPDADYIIVNEVEAQQLAHGLGVSGTEPADIAKKLAAKTGHTVIVTMAARGAVAVRDGVTWHVDSLPVEVVDTTGAGDTFCGVFAACLQAGMEWTAALHRAGVGASLKCLGLGAQSGMPTMEDIETNLSKIQAPKKI